MLCPGDGLGAAAAARGQRAPGGAARSHVRVGTPLGTPLGSPGAGRAPGGSAGRGNAASPAGGALRWVQPGWWLLPLTGGFAQSIVVAVTPLLRWKRLRGGPCRLFPHPTWYFAAGCLSVAAPSRSPAQMRAGIVTREQESTRGSP